MHTATCVKAYQGLGYLRENTDKSKTVHIKIDDKIDVDDQGYLWFKNVCFGHKDAYVGDYFDFTKQKEA